MASSKSVDQFADKTALVTGANSGLGFEAAAQLAEAGYDRVILACRTLAKAEAAKQALAERVGLDPFETLEVDVSSIDSANAAGDELVRRGTSIDTLLLNAGVLSGENMVKSADGLEIAFASSIIGHYVLTLRLLDAGLLPDGGRVVIAGSESANNDVPAMMDMNLYDFATDAPQEFGDNLHDAMARKFGDRISIFTVSPGANLSTNAARHSRGFKRFLFTKVMPAIGPVIGMGQHISVGAKRYLDVLHGVGRDYVNGKTYTSAAKKFVGPLHEMEHPHLLDVERQEVAWNVLSELTGTVEREPLQSRAAE
jgi:NAD(P)-dependent dehydrogenase (short-subunit alcohol dehydrogenase family)